MVIFATLGDGVPDASVQGPEGFVIDHFHTLAWAALATAFLTASLDSPTTRRLARPLALTALALYAVFRIALHRHF